MSLPKQSLNLDRLYDLDFWNCSKRENSSHSSLLQILWVILKMEKRLIKYTIIHDKRFFFRGGEKAKWKRERESGQGDIFFLFFLTASIILILLKGIESWPNYVTINLSRKFIYEFIICRAIKNKLDMLLCHGR